MYLVAIGFVNFWAKLGLILGILNHIGEKDLHMERGDILKPVGGTR